MVGTFPSWYGAGEIDTNVMSWFAYEALAPLAGNYQQSAATFGGDFNMVGAVSTTCEHPDVAFAMLDYLIGEEGWYVGAMGTKGEDYEFVDAESWYGTSPSMKKIDDGNKIETDFWNASQFPRWDKEELRYGKTRDDSVIETDNTWVLLKAAQKYEPYYVNHNIPKIVWADEDVLVVEKEYATLIEEYILTANTEFVMGRKDINNDADWQEYLDTLDSMGLQEYIELLYT